MKRVSSGDRRYDLWVILNQARDMSYRARRNELHKYGISPVHVAVLHSIHCIGENAMPVQIARWLVRAPHTVSNILDRMGKQGLIRKTKDLDRKNFIRVTLTEKGRKVYYQSAKRESIHKIMSSLSEDERQQLRSSLHKIRDASLKELGIEYWLPFPP